VAEAGLPGVWVTLGGLRGKNLLTTVLFPLKLVRCCRHLSASSVTGRG
jgi:hypothetical protein